MITDYDKLIPQGVLFNLVQIQDMNLIKIDMSKKLIDQGRLEVVRIGTKLHIPRTELIRYLEDNTTEKTA